LRARSRPLPLLILCRAIKSDPLSLRHTRHSTHPHLQFLRTGSTCNACSLQFHEKLNREVKNCARKSVCAKRTSEQQDPDKTTSKSGQKKTGLNKGAEGKSGQWHGARRKNSVGICSHRCAGQSGSCGRPSSAWSCQRRVKRGNERTLSRAKWFAAVQFAALPPPAACFLAMAFFSACCAFHV
jgi:hypothetical protein